MALEKLIGHRTSSAEEHWISISDLMAGLMVIFLFVAITYIRPIIATQNEVSDIVVSWKDTELDIHRALNQEFEHDLDNWHAELDRETMSIRFKAPEVLFKSGTADLQPEFQTILDDFFPLYLDVLNRFQNSISEIRIEGHTSSEWEGAATEYEAYIKNMELSQTRTRSVLEYVLGLKSIALFKEWARPKLTANGLSSSQLVYKDSKEDKAQSRRVEFRVRTDTKQHIIQVLEAIDGTNVRVSRIQ